jgi:hypothetical protein
MAVEKCLIDEMENAYILFRAEKVVEVETELREP